MLADGQKRQAYDRFGHQGVDPNMGGGAGFGGGDSFNDIFGDVFGDIFGGGGRGRGGRSGPRRGSDLRYNLELSLEEAVAGKKVEIKVPTLVSCTTCNGSGAKRGLLLLLVLRVAELVRFVCNKDSLPFNKPVPLVADKVRRSKILVAAVMGAG